MQSLSFAVLKQNYPRKIDVDHDALFREIGWDDLIGNPAYENTCATRVSLALIRSGITIPGGRIAIKKGPFKGQMIEPGQDKLSHILATRSMFGSPEKFSTKQAESSIGLRSGIVSFFRLIPGVYEHGHIDIVSPQLGGIRVCGTGCYWSSREIWFWPLI
ncbi:type VI secretion system amidase effector protein Tae4 [Massilia solisilvae]|uniref:Type VI secretion system amidase effector protein Tae4 n=1 Tax=Massilia solisilvae TaxID=1811225 RepID=A0ABT2BPD1_9BURK|nr:type VI secretion system amidase effector protein Tae4 [Massilia solisilvae]MCS0610354.1 type VI secretion system amidase effector protein Tae4 [Massilia solisilvae]